MVIDRWHRIFFDGLNARFLVRISRCRKWLIGVEIAWVTAGRRTPENAFVELPAQRSVGLYILAPTW